MQNFYPKLISVRINISFFDSTVVALHDFMHFVVGGETLQNVDSSSGTSSSHPNSQLKFNDNTKWHKVSVIKSGFETILVVDNYRSSTHNRRDITFEGSQDDSNGKTWTKRKLNVPENIGVDKV